MDTLGIEPRASRMLSGCDTTTPCAHLQNSNTTCHVGFYQFLKTLVSKTLQSAIANAENNNNLSSDTLTIESATVEQGPAFKRFRPVARGSAHPYKKRTSNIRIVLTDQT